jgi:hypothetical protein
VEGENPGIQAVAEDVMTGVDEPMQGDEEPLPALVADEEQDEPMRTVEDPTPAVEDFADASEDWAAHDAQDAEQGFEEGDAALFFDVAEGDEEDELQIPVRQAAQGGDDVVAPHAAPRRNTSAWYRENARSPVFMGCTTSVIQAAYLLLAWKHMFTVGDNCINALLKVIRHAFLSGVENMLPPSLHMLRRILDSPNLEDFTYHVCEDDCYIFPDQPPATQYEAMATSYPPSQCPECLKPRFVMKSGQWKPAKYCLYFGIARAVQKFFSMPIFCSSLGKGRDYFNTAQWWGSPDARLMNIRLGGKLFAENSTISPYSIGFDFAEIFTFKNWSTGLFFIRCEDLDPKLRAKKFSSQPLMVIPGPSQPKKIKPYLELILKDFQDYGPDGKLLILSTNGKQVTYIHL